MKKMLRYSLLVFFVPLFSKAQITTPIIKANFGIDADLRCNFFNNLVQSGNDDWFKLPGSSGTGEFIIDTTGAADMLTQYAGNVNFRKLPFFRNMRFPAYSTVNNRLLIDGVFVRDYHGDDSTIFASGSNKNGMSPANWSCPVSQSIPDKNEILDMMLHVRRAGPNLTDSLWLMAGLSIENTTGNRYFDFEMYQTDIYYDRATRSFYNYGPDEGHTTWQFDAMGEMTAPGDIILTAEYSSSSLTAIEARIWINKNDLSITPANFTWTGSFDGDGNGAQFGYAGIQPKTSGAFYTGLQSGNNTWAGPFSLILGDNSIQTNYVARQYMEFSVNLSKLGLDNAKLFGGDDCLMPFRRLMAKTRASTSFTAELKDFIAPFDFFLAPKANVETMMPVICDTGSISNIYVSNPLPTSIYEWSTINGNIVGSTTGPSIYVDTPGVYIVKQYLQTGCSLYASDTITIGSFGDCNILANNIIDFNTQLIKNDVELSWKVSENEWVDFFEIERSTDGMTYTVLKRIYPLSGSTGLQQYFYMDPVGELQSEKLYYRVRIKQKAGPAKISPVNLVLLHIPEPGELLFYPNPVKDQLQLRIHAVTSAKAILHIFDVSGRTVKQMTLILEKGINIFNLDGIAKLVPGFFYAEVMINNKKYSQKLVIAK